MANLKWVFFALFLQGTKCFPLIFAPGNSRDWRIPETDPVGSRVYHAVLQNDDGSSHISNVTFGLAPASIGVDFSGFFRIDESGQVYLKESLMGRKGESGFLAITAVPISGPQLKLEVRVRIVGGGNDQQSRPPYQPGLFTPQIPPGFPTFSTTTIISNGIASIVPINNNSTEISTTLSTTTVTSFTSDGDLVEKVNNVTFITSNEISEAVNDDKDEEEEENNMTSLISIPIVILTCLILIVLGIYLVNNRRKNSLNKRPVKEMRKESVLSTTSSNATPFTTSMANRGKRATSNRYEDGFDFGIENCSSTEENRRDPWEIPRHTLKIIGILGEGCFGQVWRCEATNNGKVETVAVKTLKESAGERERLDLVSELAVMKGLEFHPNVVRLIGCCTEKDPLFVVMEYVSHGKLQTFLRNSRAEHYYGNLHSDSGSLSSKDLTSFAYQVSRGMEFLASKGIIHRDLAARNVLIDKDRTCKVADFGFARDVVENQVYERKSDGRLPIRWMAPEALFDNIFTTKTDVWSFGVLMWEIVTLGSTPYPGLGAAEVMRKVREGYRLEKPEHCRRELYNIMFYCWSHKAESRPTFGELGELLSQLLHSETDYLDLDQFPEHCYYNLSCSDNVIGGGGGEVNVGGDFDVTEEKL